MADAPSVPWSPSSRHVTCWASTPRAEKLASAMDITTLSNSQFNVMAAELDDLVEGFRSRRLDGPYTIGASPGSGQARA